MLAFCDADDVVRPGWVASMWAALSDADLVAGVYDFGALDGVPSPFPVPAASRQLGFLPFGLSANLAVTREVFEAVRGFDETLSPEEDVDLCWRLQLAGNRFAVATDAIVEKRERPAGLPTFRGAWAYGRCGPRLYTRYRSRGMRRDLAGAGKAWIWLVATLPTLVLRSRTPPMGAHVRDSIRPTLRIGPPPCVLSLIGCQPRADARRRRRTALGRGLHCTSQVVPT